MAAQAERTDVFKIAFATAFRNRQDVIRIPQRPAADSFQAPVSKEFLPPRIFGSLESNVGLHGVGPAEHAHSLVTQEDLLTQVPGVRAQTPLVNTILGTEGEAPGRHFKRAPAAKTASVFSFRQRISMDVSARHRSLGAHLAWVSLVFFTIGMESPGYERRLCRLCRSAGETISRDGTDFRGLVLERTLVVYKVRVLTAKEPVWHLRRRVLRCDLSWFPTSAAQNASEMGHPESVADLDPRDRSHRACFFGRSG
jgi:hypothetical protein